MDRATPMAGRITAAQIGTTATGITITGKFDLPD
jgi:hypothetical protein